MSNLLVTPTRIPEVLVLEPKVFGDERGWFYESFNAAQFLAATGIQAEFVQDNQSFSKKNTLRGLHYQVEKTQGKLVRVTAGAVFDVAVDLRQSSAHFGKWVGAELSAQNHRQMWIPAGFAHGFFVLSDAAEFLYKTTDYYYPQGERCLAWNDPTVGVVWPIPEGIEPTMNAKDLTGFAWNQAPKF
ncbi:dTDP-4-dehydrorhamnose 3,5-epimerase [Polynucleobacter sp. IMCC30063]|uniref:dTDP-4-dehydrorhamnose 3,5-epimerase n=1 Tax=unclassified Polynucleobacter TaxID=2640945 RepID=UPI001F3EC6EE|nr:MULTISPECIES: dTDP-4-dehydrorhamnose 3,5-epimerase [unclassified Polynucleobacter]MCE7505179.1 dTDP-4-dehydrorhamnose 3,5-epimerase [Polynucleobacter sp. IMCC30063]MCE7526028.1 dTDP-4-dehydrorhamnose 3,5-epimerase [Polynucleobacter sp. IMCC 30228]